MSVRKHVVVRGMVQGVGFRENIRRHAGSRGVAGWVRNRGDGAVEAVFEGDADAVESLVRFVCEGPRHADVDDVDIHDEEPEGLSGFEIR